MADPTPPTVTPASEATNNEPDKPRISPKWQKLGIGAAIGSAAIAAALLYANRSKPEGRS